jgi:transcriptional regulator with XRE-family HTH domain
MKPATSQSPKNIRKQVGPAVWLLALFVCFAPADWTGDAPVHVARGNVVTDAELAERLGVSQRTIAKWCRRLRAAGLIGWLVAPREGRVFWIGAVNRIFGIHSEVKPSEQKPAGEPGAVDTDTPPAVPAGQRWVQ